MNLRIAAAWMACLTWTPMATAGEDASRSTPLRAINVGAYKTLADDALKAFKAGDMATAKKKAKELEKAWDTTGKADLAKKQDLWKEIDTALDGFIDPILKEEKPDPAKVDAGYKEFIAKLNKAA